MSVTADDVQRGRTVEGVISYFGGAPEKPTTRLAPVSARISSASSRP
jgi:hypothetical protein